MADPPPDNFIGIKWGATVTEAREALFKRPGVNFDHKASAHDVLRLTGGTFGGFDVDTWELFFGPRGFQEAVVVAQDSAGGDSFQKMKAAITEKYGGGRAVAVGTRPPPSYNWIEGQWENRKANKPSPDMTWNLRTSFTSHMIHILCTPRGGNRVRIAYRNETLAKEPAASPAKANAKPLKSDL